MQINAAWFDSERPEVPMEKLCVCSVCVSVYLYMHPQSDGGLVKDHCYTSNVYFLGYPAAPFSIPGGADPISPLSEGILDNKLGKQAGIKVFRATFSVPLT